jgi:tetratricopeptide (TPR) repeat protein
LRDGPALQADIKRDIAERLGLKVTPPSQKAAAAVNPEAYDGYLRGRFYLYRQTKEGNEAAIAAFEKAVAADPNFAAAHAELAQAYVWKLFLFDPDDKELAEKAFVAVEKALALDADSAVAYLARGRLLWTPANHFPHDRSIREYRRALALDPALYEARNQLALVYCHIGALDEALQESRQALNADPNNHLAQFRIAETLSFQGKYEEALSALRAIPADANPALVGHQIAWCLFNLGRKDEAAATLDKFLAEYPEDNRGLLTSLQAVLLASQGQPALAEAKIDTSIRKGKGFGHFHHTAYLIACAYALMNKPEPAVKWLESAADDGFPCYPLFVRDPNLNALRNDAGFLTFLAKSKEKWEYHQKVLRG